MNSDDTFYPERPPEEALDAYLASLDNLYDHTRAAYLRLRGNRNWRGWDTTHLRFYTPGKLKKLAADCGLRPVAWHSAYQFPHRFLTRLICRRIIEYKVLYLPDLILHAKWPFSRTGWALGVMLERPAQAQTLS